MGIFLSLINKFREFKEQNAQHLPDAPTRTDVSALGCTQILILDKAASKRVCGSLLTHKASESRFNEVKSTKEQKTFMLWKRIVAMLHMRL